MQSYKALLTENREAFPFTLCFICISRYSMQTGKLKVSRILVNHYIQQVAQLWQRDRASSINDFRLGGQFEAIID